VIRSGSAEIVADVFRINRTWLEREEGFAQLVKEGFIDQIKDSPPGIYTGEDEGVFDVETAPTLTISILLDGTRLTTHKFKIQRVPGRVDFKKLS
jgi:hypothetical protein